MSQARKSLSSDELEDARIESAARAFVSDMMSPERGKDAKFDFLSESELRLQFRMAFYEHVGATRLLQAAQRRLNPSREP